MILSIIVLSIYQTYVIQIMINKTVKLYSDMQLCGLIKKGQKQGFDLLYDCYSDLLYGLIIRSTELRAYAEEILELTFLNIWNFIQNLKDQQINIRQEIIRILLSSIKAYLDSRRILFTLYMEQSLFIFKILV